jgi:hypothetical protein
LKIRILANDREAAEQMARRLFPEKKIIRIVSIGTADQSAVRAWLDTLRRFSRQKCRTHPWKKANSEIAPPPKAALLLDRRETETETIAETETGIALARNAFEQSTSRRGKRP